MTSVSAPTPTSSSSPFLELRMFNRALWSLVLIGLVLRVAAVFLLNDYVDPLTAEYGVVARNLVEGRGFVGGGWLGPEGPTALNTPVYPAFLALWLRLGVPLPYLGVQLTQAVLSALIVYLVGRIAHHLGDSLTGLIAGGIAALYPPLIYFSKQISPAIVTSFSTVLSFYVILLLLDDPSWRRALLGGLVFGISLLVEPVLLVGLPGAVAVAWWFEKRGNRSDLLKKLAVSIVLCSLVVLPWAVRNYQVFGRIMPLKTSFGLNLWMGNNPNATGYLYTDAGEPMQSTVAPEMREYLAGLNEAERYAFLGHEAWRWIQAHPQQFLSLTLKRVGYFWWISPTYRSTDQNIVEPRLFYVVRGLIQAPMLLLGFLGGVLALRTNRRLLVSCGWWLVAFTLPYVVSVAGNTRFRLPAEPMLIVLVACALAEATRRWQSKQEDSGPAHVR